MLSSARIRITETASEGEGEYDETCGENFISHSIQSDFEILCEHRFSVTVLRAIVRGRDSEENYLNHLTVFSSH